MENVVCHQIHNIGTPSVYFAPNRILYGNVIVWLNNKIWLPQLILFRHEFMLLPRNFFLSSLSRRKASVSNIAGDQENVFHLTPSFTIFLRGLRLASFSWRENVLYCYGNFLPEMIRSLGNLSSNFRLFQIIGLFRVAQTNKWSENHKELVYSEKNASLKSHDC